MKKETWVIVANSSEARIFKVTRNALGEEIASLIHPQSRLANQELVSSGPGTAYDSFGMGRHHMEPPTSPKLQEMMQFAKDLALRLDKARNAGTLDHFYIAANPSFLGHLRQELNGHTLKLLKGEVMKDLVHLEPKAMRDYFPPVL